MKFHTGDLVTCRFGRPLAPDDPTKVVHLGGDRVPLETGKVRSVDGERVIVDFGGVSYAFVGGVLEGYGYELEAAKSTSTRT